MLFSSFGQAGLPRRGVRCGWSLAGRHAFCPRGLTDVGPRVVTSDRWGCTLGDSSFRWWAPRSWGFGTGKTGGTQGF